MQHDIKMKDKSGQAVFIGILFGAFMLLIFFIALPILGTFFDQAKASIDEPFVKMVIGFLPFFVFIMICWITLKIMRSE
jgi:Na+-driven multidrug efflux pump